MKIMLGILLLTATQTYASEDGGEDKASLAACQRYKTNDETLKTSMNTGVDPDCRKAIEDGRRSCFSERSLSDEDRETLTDDGGEAAGGNKAARIESKRNSLLKKKMEAATGRCRDAKRKVREVCGRANDNFKEALKDKETALNSDLAKRQTATSYAYQAGERLMDDAATCTVQQGRIYEAAASRDEQIADVSSERKHDDEHGDKNGHGEHAEHGEHEHTPGQRDIHAVVHHGGEKVIGTGGEILHHAADTGVFKAAGRVAAKGAGPLAIALSSNDDVTGPLVTTGGMVAEAAGAGMRATVGGGLAGALILHTTPAGVRCDGVFNPVDAAAKGCPYNSNWGAQSIDSASRLLEHP